MGPAGFIRGLIVWIALVSAPSLAFAAPKSISPADLASIHSIAVISAIGDKAMIKRTGSTVFGNKESNLDIADWKLDEFVAQAVAAALGPRFTVTSIAADQADFTPRMQGGLIRFGIMPDLSELIRRLPPSGADAYLVIVKIPRLLDPPNQAIEGVGMYLHKGLFGLGTKPTIFATFSIAVVRARTGEILAQRTAQAPSAYYPTTTAPFPFAIGGKADWADAEDLTAAQMETFHEAVTTLLTSAIGFTLPRMGLKAAAY